MDVPSPLDGVVKELKVRVGDKVSEGSLILIAEADLAPAGVAPPQKVREGGHATGEGAPVADYGAASGVYFTIEVRVPDIGDFKNVPVIEILVKPGDMVKPEDPLVTLESDKATMDVPSPQAGNVAELKVKMGDKVSEGSVILTLEAGAAAEDAKPTEAAQPRPRRRARPKSRAPFRRGRYLLRDDSAGRGSGRLFGRVPRGRSWPVHGPRRALPTLGGVCLNVGCIPSKALLHTAAIMDEVKAMAAHGIGYSACRKSTSPAAQAQGEGRRQTYLGLRRYGEGAEGDGGDWHRPLS